MVVISKVLTEYQVRQVVEYFIGTEKGKAFTRPLSNNKVLGLIGQ